MGKPMGEIIRQLRRERNLTQKQLAELIGVGDRAISKWECGDGLPDISQLVPLADAFGVSADALLGRVPVNRVKKENAEYIDIGDLDLSVAAAGRLAAAGICTVAELTEKTAVELMENAKVAPKNVEEIVRKLEMLGLTLKE
ncbi:MAG: helix-turn-helix domain-containing protein [Oscillospiraceae bacterium]|nr:helix-turn-helix domain-containing protein [Oscillospiraceae bacterium]